MTEGYMNTVLYYSDFRAITSERLSVRNRAKTARIASF